MALAFCNSTEIKLFGPALDRIRVGLPHMNHLSDERRVNHLLRDQLCTARPYIVDTVIPNKPEFKRYQGGNFDNLGKNRCFIIRCTMPFEPFSLFGCIVNPSTVRLVGNPTEWERPVRLGQSLAAAITVSCIFYFSLRLLRGNAARIKAIFLPYCSANVGDRVVHIGARQRPQAVAVRRLMPAQDGAIPPDDNVF